MGLVGDVHHRGLSWLRGSSIEHLNLHVVRIQSGQRFLISGMSVRSRIGSIRILACFQSFRNSKSVVFGVFDLYSIFRIDVTP